MLCRPVNVLSKRIEGCIHCGSSKTLEMKISRRQYYWLPGQGRHGRGSLLDNQRMGSTVWRCCDAPKALYCSAGTRTAVTGGARYSGCYSALRFLIGAAGSVTELLAGGGSKDR
jgi:hypothetical protein